MSNRQPHDRIVPDADTRNRAGPVTGHVERFDDIARMSPAEVDRWN